MNNEIEPVEIPVKFQLSQSNAEKKGFENKYFTLNRTTQTYITEPLLIYFLQLK